MLERLAKPQISIPYNLAQTLDDLGKLFGGGTAQFTAQPFDREGSDLADFNPGFFRKFFTAQFKSQGKAGLGFLAGQGHGDNRARSFVENIMA